MTTTKTSLLALTAVFLAHSAPVQASDILTDPSSAYVQGNAAPVRINWTGLYVGGAIGYGNANHDLSVRDYFKDFCYDGDPLTLEPFEDPNHGVPARTWTLDNKNSFFSDDENPFASPNFVSAPSCEELDINGPSEAPDGFAAGDYVTVPGDSREVASLDGLNSTGLVGDARLGYDQQAGRFVFGVFGTYGLSDMEADGSIGGVGSFTLERGDDWSLGARAGALVNDRTLLYILAAYTETEYDLNVHDAADATVYDKTTNFTGITVGGGIEFALNQTVFLGLEGTHTFYDDETILDVYDPASNVGMAVNDELGETKIMGTLKIKLNQDVFGN